jgi:hypothetical protein
MNETADRGPADEALEKVEFIEPEIEVGDLPAVTTGSAGGSSSSTVT